jgi:hypothetical protein
VRPEGLDKLIEITQLIGSRTRDLPGLQRCTLTTMLPRAPKINRPHRESNRDLPACSIVASLSITIKAMIKVCESGDRAPYIPIVGPGEDISASRPEKSVVPSDH